MKNNQSKSALGFLTVIDHPQHGLCGGYLVLNGRGRPLEFHCTSPIKPNRAQQILYGPTLEPFLYGEQIGQTLVAKAKAEPLVVYTDLVPALAVRLHISAPVAVVLASSHETNKPAEALPLVRFRAGCNELAVFEENQQDCDAILERMGDLVEAFDLMEPFQRIREAIEEAQKSVRQSA